MGGGRPGRGGVFQERIAADGWSCFVVVVCSKIDHRVDHRMDMENCGHQGGHVFRSSKFHDSNTAVMCSTGTGTTFHPGIRVKHYYCVVARSYTHVKKKNVPVSLRLSTACFFLLFFLFF